MKRISVVLIALMFFACSSNVKDRLDIDISQIEIEDFQIQSYGKDLFEIDTLDFNNQLAELALKYPYFLENVFADIKYVNQFKDYVTDPKMIELNETTQLFFPDRISLEDELQDAFKHYKYYFPKNLIPTVYTFVSGLSFEEPIIYKDDVIAIAIDLYLGSDFELYKELGVPNYIAELMQKQYISVDCMRAMAINHVLHNQTNKTLLDQMIYYGKVLYFIDAMLPQKEDRYKIGYTQAQYDWCIQNESKIWSIFIEEELLFSNDYQKTSKFILPGPFTQSISNESPAALGIWIGWQIISSFMENNPDISLEELLTIRDPKLILQDSKYKPNR